MNLCPHCQGALSSLNADTIPVQGPKALRFAGVVFTCPLCQTIITAGIDPILLTDQIRAEIRKEKR